MELWQKCLLLGGGLCPQWDGALPAAKKWSRQYFRREETSFLPPHTQIYWEQSERWRWWWDRGWYSVCPCKVLVLWQMHDIKDVRKYSNVMSDKEMGESTSSGWENRAHLPAVFWGKSVQMPQRGKLSYIWEREMECLPKVIPTKSCIIHCQSNRNFCVNWSMIIGSVSVLFSFLRACPGAEPTLWPVEKSGKDLLSSSKITQANSLNEKIPNVAWLCMHCSALWECSMHLQCPSKCRKMQKYAVGSQTVECVCSSSARASNSCWILWWNSLHVLHSVPPVNAKPPCSVECSLISSTCHY